MANKTNVNMDTKKSKQSKPKDKSSRYFERVLQKIRKIRASEMPPLMKVEALLHCTVDYKKEEAEGFLKQLIEVLLETCLVDGGRIINLMLLYAERRVCSGFRLKMTDFWVGLDEWVLEISNNLQLYNYPCFRGVYDYDFHEDEFDEWDANVALPPELEDYKYTDSMVLRVIDGDWLIDVFNSSTPDCRRAYDVLADLDKRVLVSLKTGVFKEWIHIPYSVGGVAMFQFSHFEVNLSEPDPQFRTLYVVYRYDTSAS